MGKAGRLAEQTVLAYLEVRQH